MSNTETFPAYDLVAGCLLKKPFTVQGSRLSRLHVFNVSNILNVLKVPNVAEGRLVCSGQIEPRSGGADQPGVKPRGSRVPNRKAL